MVIRLKKLLLGIFLLFFVVSMFAAISHEEIKDDLNYMRDLMTNVHGDFFNSYKKENFYKDIEDLKSRLTQMNIYEIKYAIQEILAKANDGHTEVSGLFNNNALFPYELVYYDGIYTWALPKKYEEYLGWKVNSINYIKIDKIIERVDRLSNEDNIYGLKKNFEDIINKAQALEYLEIASNNQVTFSLEKDGKKANIVVKVNDKGKTYLKRNRWFSDGKKVDEPFWLGDFKGIGDKKGVYIQYNECYSKEVYEKLASIEEYKELTKKNLERYPSVEETFREYFKDKKDNYNFVVIDLRNNSGGSVIPTMYMVIELISQPQLMESNFYVLTDRTTFSSGILSTYMFDKFLNATVIGEPPSGKPNHPTEVKKVKLPNSKITIRYPSKEGVLKDMKGNVYDMDHLIEPTFKDFIGEDIMIYKVLEIEDIL